VLKRFDPARPRSVVLWAVATGLLAGLAVAGYHTLVSEPLIDDAIAIEEAREAGQPGAGADHGDDAADGGTAQVSRSDQRGAGLFGGYALLGAASGLVLSVVALSLRGRWLDPFQRVLLSAAILATATTAAPWLKYPPNPPGVGDPGTAGERQRLYWLLMILGGLLLAGAAHLSGRWRERGWPRSRRVVTIAAGLGVSLAVVLVALPANPDTIPADIPAGLLWRFRVASLGGNLLLWGLLALGFGWLWAERSNAEAAAAGRAHAGSPAAADHPAPA
jgi:predicted cobalt transporter CbtA